MDCAFQKGNNHYAVNRRQIAADNMQAVQHPKNNGNAQDNCGELLKTLTSGYTALFNQHYHEIYAQEDKPRNRDIIKDMIYAVRLAVLIPAGKRKNKVVQIICEYCCYKKCRRYVHIF